MKQRHGSAGKCFFRQTTSVAAFIPTRKFSDTNEKIQSATRTAGQTEPDAHRLQYDNFRGDSFVHGDDFCIRLNSMLSDRRSHRRKWADSNDLAVRSALVLRNSSATPNRLQSGMGFD